MAFTTSTLIEHSPTARLVSRLCLTKVPALGLKCTEAPKSMAPGRRRKAADSSTYITHMSKIFELYEYTDRLVVFV